MDTQMPENKLTDKVPYTSIRAWFFDLDGTLMDTDDQTVNKLSKRLHFLGERLANKIARFFVMKRETPMNFAVTIIDMLGMDTFLLKLRKWVNQRQPQPTFLIIPGVKSMLEDLQSHAILAVVSTRTYDDAITFLQQHELASCFTLVVTQESTKRLKPDPEPILYAADALNIPLDVCAMIGDTTVDMRAARRAGAWAVGVLCGFGEEKELRRAGAHVILASTADLNAYVR
jgi:HAD superfamily hydrolase (TIGR01549 family)